MVQPIHPEQIDPSGANAGTVMGVSNANNIGLFAMSVPTLLLPANSNSSAVPANTPVGTLIFIKA